MYLAYITEITEIFKNTFCRGKWLSVVEESSIETNISFDILPRIC